MLLGSQGPSHPKFCKDGPLDCQLSVVEASRNDYYQWEVSHSCFQMPLTWVIICKTLEKLPWRKRKFRSILSATGYNKTKKKKIMHFYSTSQFSKCLSLVVMMIIWGFLPLLLYIQLHALILWWLFLTKLYDSLIKLSFFPYHLWLWESPQNHSPLFL